MSSISGIQPSILCISGILMRRKFIIYVPYLSTSRSTLIISLCGFPMFSESPTPRTSMSSPGHSLDSKFSTINLAISILHRILFASTNKASLKSGSTQICLNLTFRLPPAHPTIKVAQNIFAHTKSSKKAQKMQ